MKTALTKRTNILAVLTLLIATMSIAYAGPAGDAAAPRPGSDSANPVTVPGMVVQSDRIPMSVWEIPGAVYASEIGAAERMWFRSTGELAGSIPGIRSYPLGNPWGQSVVDVRGFYGGGQAQYLLVTMDGIPLNDISSGLVSFSSIDLASVDRVEATRGPVSAQYGDFGFGGMLSLYTSPADQSDPVRLHLTGGSDDAVGGEATLEHRFGDYDLSATIASRDNDGWREHSALEQRSALLGIERPLGSAGKLKGTFSYADTEEQNPGALTEDALASDRTGAATDFFGTPLPDRTNRRDFLAGITTESPLNADVALLSRAHLKITDGDNIVTTTQTMYHEPDLLTAGLEVSSDIAATVADRSLRVNIGVSGEYGRLETAYREYETPANTISAGTGNRSILAGFAKGAWEITDPVTISGGLRFDYVNTKFTHDQSAVAEDGEELSMDASRLSPSLAVSARLNKHITGFASVAGAFKAPTLLHLYDSPPFGIFDPEMGMLIGYMLISNNELEPMTGTNVELGFKITGDQDLFAGVNFFSYWLRDEIDFSLATLSYVNVGKSRHIGVEANVSRTILASLSGDAAVTYNKATIEDGELDGNQLNGVPEWSYRFGLAYDYGDLFSVNAAVSGIATQYLDEENTRQLDDYTTVSAGGTVFWSVLEFGVRVTNLLDEEYEYDGYLDPLMMGAARFYPAPGRQFIVTVGSRF